MNDIELVKRNEIALAMSAIELEPLAARNEIALQTYTKVPLSRIKALGAGLETVVAAVQQVTSKGNAVSGYYKVTIPPGTHLANFTNSSDKLGAVLDGNNKLVGQARLNPLMCDPTMLFVAAAMANIDKKLDSIQETQQEMLDFIVQKEKSALKGSLEFLIDIFNNYKYNWNNDKYKRANHIKALDIRLNAAKAIDFYREQIKAHAGKKPILHSDQDVKKLMDRVTDDFKEYRLALYLFSFAYFEEVLLMKTGESDLYFEVSGVEYAILIDVDMGVCTYKLSFCGDGIEGREEFACLDDLLAYKFCGELTFREMWDRGFEIDFL